MARLRSAATVVALIVLPLVLSARLLQSEFRKRANATPDVISAQVARYRDLVAALPAPGPLGYLSDVALGTSRQERGEWYDDYLIARYALRPWHLQPRPEGEWVVGQFEEPTRVTAAAAEHGLEVYRDFGDGVFLLRR